MAIAEVLIYWSDGIYACRRRPRRASRLKIIEVKEIQRDQVVRGCDVRLKQARGLRLCMRTRMYFKYKDQLLLTLGVRRDVFFSALVSPSFIEGILLVSLYFHS